MAFVPFHRPHFSADDSAAAMAVLQSGFHTMGQEVFAFEAAFAERHGRRHAVMVNACTNGHMLVLRYLRDVVGLPAGTKTVFPATTFCGPSFQACHAGFDVDLADTDPSTGASDLAQFAPHLEAGAQIVAPMPYAGVPLPGMRALLEVASEHGVRVLEDCAHAVGARDAQGALVGSLPTYASIFSFYPTKILNAVEGGMILTDEDDLADWCRSARLHGVDRPVAGRYQSATSDWGYGLSVMGYKCNPNNLQGAIGQAQLARLPETLARLQEIAARYHAALAGSGLTPIDRQAAGNQHLFILRDAPREALLAHMKAHEVQCSVHYPPLWRMAAWAAAGRTKAWDLPGAERFAAGCISLPIYAGLSQAEVDQVCNALASFR